MRHHTLFIALLLLSFCLGAVAPGEARGKGPIGLWPVDERYVVLADSSLPGLVLVDLRLGLAVERLPMSKGRPIGVTGCADCDFLLVTGGDARIWTLPLPAPPVQLLQETGQLGFNSGSDIKPKLVPLTFTGPLKIPGDARLPLLSADGSTAYVAASNDRTVYRIDLDNENRLSVLLKDPRHEPYGLNWGKDGNLLVTMHRKEVLRVDSSGKKLATYNIHAADCPGAKRFDPILRAALDDPTSDDSVFILSTNPHSYDAVIWRYKIADKPSCEIVAGSIGRDSGWVDGSGTDAVFSRPHYFVHRPGAQPPQVLISDIDNRALRFLHLSTMNTSSVMYDRDVRLKTIHADTPPKAGQCSAKNKAQWTQHPADSATGGSAFCQPATAEPAPMMALAEAQAHCAAQGAQLCEPAQWQTIPLPQNTMVWTSAKCASCWKKRRKSECPAAIETFKSAGVHKDKTFEQRWHSGQAVAYRPDNSSELRLECVAKEEARKAVVSCCAS